MSSKRIHVVPNGNAWAVKREENQTPISNHRTRESAIDAGRPVSRRDQTELVTHKPNGAIRDSDSYGPDPSSSTDTKH